VDFFAITASFALMAKQMGEKARIGKSGLSQWGGKSASTR
jgi:hypothetical protein